MDRQLLMDYCYYDDQFGVLFLYEKFQRNQIFYILLILIIDISECLRDDLDGYEVLNYLEEKKYILNKTESDEKMFRLKMDVDKILSSDCLIDIHQIDPQKVYLYYNCIGGEIMEKTYNKLDDLFLITIELAFII